MQRKGCQLEEEEEEEEEKEKEGRTVYLVLSIFLVSCNHVLKARQARLKKHFSDLTCLSNAPSEYIQRTFAIQHTCEQMVMLHYVFTSCVICKQTTHCCKRL